MRREQTFLSFDCCSSSHFLQHKLCSRETEFPLHFHRTTVCGHGDERWSTEMTYICCFRNVVDVTRIQASGLWSVPGLWTVRDQLNVGVVESGEYCMVGLFSPRPGFSKPKHCQLLQYKQSSPSPVSAPANWIGTRKQSTVTLILEVFHDLFLF